MTPTSRTMVTATSRLTVLVCLSGAVALQEQWRHDYLRHNTFRG